MNKNQFIIFGVLSLIAAVGTTSTLSAYAELKPNDTMGFLGQSFNDQASASNFQNFAQLAKPSFNSQDFKDFADKLSKGADINSILGSLNQQPTQ